jgi:serine/threonine-protein kinase
MQNSVELGPYTLGQEFGRTVASRSFRATRSQTGARVLLTHLSSPTAKAQADFDRVLRVLKDLALPQMATIADSGTSPSFGSYVALEQPEGVGLDALLAEKGRLDEHTVHALAKHMCAVVGALGEANLIHGFLRPASFVVKGERTESVAKLIELPLAPLHGAGSQGESHAFFSELYLAPEHVSAGAIDERTDVHSLGLVFLELLVGTERFESLRGAMLMANRPFAPEDGLSSSWNRLLARALGRDPRTRHESVVELGEEIETLYTRRSSGAMKLDAQAIASAKPQPTQAAASVAAPVPLESSEMRGLELDMGEASATQAPPEWSKPPATVTADEAPSPAPEAPPPAPSKPRLPDVPQAAMRIATAANALAERASDQATSSIGTLKTKRTGLALGGIVLAVGLVAMVFFAIIRVMDDGEASNGPHVAPTKHVLEGSGATSAH